MTGTGTRPQDNWIVGFVGFLQARVLLLCQVFGGSREIVEHGLLFRKIAGLVPLLAEFTTASNVRHHINAAAIEPEAASKVEIRRHADAVAPVAVKQRRILLVPLHSFPKNDVEWNPAAVLRSCEVARHFDIGK